MFGLAECPVAPAALSDWPDTLPTVAPSARAINLPVHYVFTRPDATAEAILAGLSALPPASLLRLRLPALRDADYVALARRVLMARPGINVKGWATREPYYEKADLEDFLDGMRLAGFPEQ